MKPIHLIPLGPRPRVRARGKCGAGAQRPGAPGGGAGTHLPHPLPHPAGDASTLSFAFDERREQYYSTAIIQRLERIADPDARVLGVTRLRPVRSGADLRIWGGAARRQLRRGVDGPAARGVLRPAGARRSAARALGQRGVARVGPHLRTAALRGLALRDGVEPRRGAAGRKGGSSSVRLAASPWCRTGVGFSEGISPRLTRSAYSHRRNRSGTATPPRDGTPPTPVPCRRRRTPAEAGWFAAGGSSSASRRRPGRTVRGR